MRPRHQAIVAFQRRARLKRSALGSSIATRENTGHDAGDCTALAEGIAVWWATRPAEDGLAVRGGHRAPYVPMLS